MYKIRRVKFHNHPVLEDLELNFCNNDDKAVDTVIIAGENGTGKSSIINSLYEIVSFTSNYEVMIEYERDGDKISINFEYGELANGEKVMFVTNGQKRELSSYAFDLKRKYHTSGIFSDVDINFHSDNLSSVTSKKLDEEKESRKSSNDLPREINQLLIDIQALDDADIAQAVRNNPDCLAGQLNVSSRISRFTNAFNSIFENLKYDRIDNRDNHKTILFNKNGRDIPIEKSSSGEKQIIYRGCFLLKDVNAINGAFVFIDEPEISLHPKWQKKILDFYKNIFTDDYGNQTSQIFVVTHSPFIIHNNRRKNDKVIVLTRDENNKIMVSDKPEYFKCTSIEAIQDAFFIDDFSQNEPTVFLEGRTDEKYFDAVVKAFNLNLPFKFKWIGYLKNSKTEEFTGKDSLNKAAHFLIGLNLPIKNVFLSDCDTKRSDSNYNNVYFKTIPLYKNSKDMSKGIENALVLDDIEIDRKRFFSCKERTGDYGEKSLISEFKKMDFCDYICSLDSAQQRKVFANLKKVIDELMLIYK